MKMLQNNEIDNFKRDGAIFLKNKFPQKEELTYRKVQISLLTSTLDI